ncbi:hypothetical protein NEPAR06_0345 [Nematocida parisii]|uniref:Uncharacterized protein n=1 Tax=Nematocida parisii (strain ERTm3) TaxID=935791 RepID=I3EGA1_NEMP3|nr:uncharacterized protein NEPG_01258 [Nematocida parisii ERTm1]EIJ88248.1 hypothetical protein NEQG_01692 [Nematocida parisii ERTm3]KAI5125379.1 hypothetical protein NEPAR03_0054 [Nematocida parisii]EIJ93686.1 hypothetical protein NEPG_01258 [Nematocida parisii ERTm1]KAI5125503.1 hypothetical protein NEPAR08_0054 [Nematocida parisii]KAI5140615.1 hypothetical protein NEPAR04_0356 [Nematocida parisii]|eukprot:XP_013059086.1 hypothetical protein NEPG_01258 [Nematocida parisii ERTm1]
MEKYTEFNDPVTGINPYIRQTKYRISLFSIIFSSILIKIVLYLPGFLYKYFFSGKFTNIANISNKKLSGGRVYLCTYTTIYDMRTLYCIFNNPMVYLVKGKNIIRVNKYGIERSTNTEEIKKAVSIGTTVVFLMGGGITNGKVYINTAIEQDISAISQYISLQYTPDITYNINLFGRWLYPQFTSKIGSFMYHLMFYATMKETPICKVRVAEALADLSEITQIEISNGLNSKTTQKFFSVFNE